MKLPASFFLALIGCIAFSCNSNSDNLWPDATGKPGELLIVIDDDKWDSSVGEQLSLFFGAEMVGLPQSEPIYDLIHLPKHAFSNLFRTNRNILLISISEKNKENKIQFKKNSWSKPQIVFQIKAKNDSAFFEIFSKYKKPILDSFIIADRKNYLSQYKKFEANNARNILKQNGIRLSIPQGYSTEVNKKKFCWFEHSTSAYTQGLLVSFIDCKDTIQYKQINLLWHIDSVLKKHVPGPVNGSYMKTDPILEPNFKDYKIQGNYAAEYRGLWSTKGYSMGGPYVMMAIYEASKNRIVLLFSFVYAPNTNKRNYIRQLEAIMSSIRFEPYSAK